MLFGTFCYIHAALQHAFDFFQYTSCGCRFRRSRIKNEWVSHSLDVLQLDN